MDERRTNPNVTPNTPGLIRLCRIELEAARVRTETQEPATHDAEESA